MYHLRLTSHVPRCIIFSNTVAPWRWPRFVVETCSSKTKYCAIIWRKKNCLKNTTAWRMYNNIKFWVTIHLKIIDGNLACVCPYIVVTWEEKNQLDTTQCFIEPVICSTCFGHVYAHYQDLATILLVWHVACNSWLLGVRRSGASSWWWA